MTQGTHILREFSLNILYMLLHGYKVTKTIKLFDYLNIDRTANLSSNSNEMHPGSNINWI